MKTLNNSEYAEVRYLKSDDIEFKETTGGFLSLKLKDGSFYPRVNLYRAFPLSKPKEFISVRDVEDKEIGIIRHLKDLDSKTVKLIKKDLDRRYFSPTVIMIESLKDEYGHVYMDIETDSGPRQITVPIGSSNFVKLKNNHIILIDVDGNRYEIKDYLKLDKKSIRLLETVI